MSEIDPNIPIEKRETLDPDRESMKQLGYALIDRIVEHLSTLSNQPIVRPGSGPQLTQQVDEPLPLHSTNLDDSIEFFFDRVMPGVTRVNHPRFHGYIPAPSSFAGMIGEFLAAGTNAFVGTWLGGGTLAALELTVLRWICELLNYPLDSSGVLTSGGSIANLTALASAREKYGARILHHGRLYVSDQGHGSMVKAAAILGFSPNAIRKIRVDENFRMRIDHLAETISSDIKSGYTPFFVAANAGSTNTGAIDPLPQIAQICNTSNLWFHVDGAYGGFAAICDEGAKQLAGMDQADSLTLDPHKWLYCPLGTGCVLVRHRESLEKAFATGGDYLKDISPDEVNFYSRGPELSRPARVLGAWMVIRTHGRDVLAKQIAEDIRLAKLAAELLRSDGCFDVLTPQLSIVAFRSRLREGESETQRSLRDDALNQALMKDGQTMLSSTLLNGINTLRLVVMNHRTSESELRRSIARIQHFA